VGGGGGSDLPPVPSSNLISPCRIGKEGKKMRSSSNGGLFFTFVSLFYPIVGRKKGKKGKKSLRFLQNFGISARFAQGLGAVGG